MDRLEEATLSQEEGKALPERLVGNTLMAEDRHTLGKVVTFYFWLLLPYKRSS